MDNLAYIKKYSELPEDVQLYFGSDDFFKNLDLLGRDHGLDPGVLASYLDILLFSDMDFEKLSREISAKSSSEGSKRLFADYVGSIWLPMQEYFKKTDFAGLIIKSGGNPADYRSHEQEFKDFIEEESIKIYDEVLKKYEELTDPEEERDAAISLVKLSILDLFQINDPEALFCLNRTLIYLLNTNKSFSHESCQAMSENQSEIADFRFSGKGQEPTVGNLIRYFISKYGSGIFDNLALSDFISTDSVIGKLGEADKKIIVRLLKLYRNLKFFPESMGELPPEQWEIVPIEHETEPQRPARRVDVRPRGKDPDRSEPPSSSDEVEEASVGREGDRLYEVLKKMREQYGIGSIERKAVEEELGKLDRIRKMRGKYMPGTLERKAVEEELSKLEGRN